MPSFTTYLVSRDYLSELCPFYVAGPYMPSSSSSPEYCHEPSPSSPIASWISLSRVTARGSGVWVGPSPTDASCLALIGVEVSKRGVKVAASGLILCASIFSLGRLMAGAALYCELDDSRSEAPRLGRYAVADGIGISGRVGGVLSSELVMSDALGEGVCPGKPQASLMILISWLALMVQTYQGPPDIRPWRSSSCSFDSKRAGGAFDAGRVNLTVGLE